MKIHCQSFVDTIDVLVLPDLVGKVDLILGNAWLRPHAADISYFHNTVTLRTLRGVYTLHCDFLTFANDVVSYVSSRVTPPELICVAKLQQLVSWLMVLDHHVNTRDWYNASV